MEILDYINAAFEFGGAVVIWLNVKRLKQDRMIAGIDWRVTVWFTLWGVFNLVLYPCLGMVASAIAGAVLCLGNMVWLTMAISLVVYARQVRKTAEGCMRGLP